MKRDELERKRRSAHPRMILARTFQRREDIDFDWYLGKADAALYSITEAGWAVVKLDHAGHITERWTLT